MDFKYDFGSVFGAVLKKNRTENAFFSRNAFSVRFSVFLKIAVFGSFFRLTVWCLV